MNLIEWFKTPASEPLRRAEDHRIAETITRFPGEVFVWATLFSRESLALREWHRGFCIATLLDMGDTSQVEGTQVYAQLSSLPYASGSVDVFIVQHGLELETDVAGCIREIARVLRDGGRSLVLSLDPRSALGIRTLLGKLPRIRLLEQVAIHSSRLTPAHSVKLCCVREGLFCESQTRILGGVASATLTEVSKQRAGVDLRAQQASQEVEEEMGLVGATSRTATACES